MRFSPQPKPQKAARGASKSTAAWVHLAGVKAQPCACCGALNGIEAHHCRSNSFGGGRASDFATIPLCIYCHRVGPLAFHNGKNGWEARNCKDFAFIPQTLQAIYGDRWSVDH